MTDANVPGPYVYQPYGMQDREHWNAGRIYAIGGVPELMTLRGLSKGEAHAICALLAERRKPENESQKESVG